MKIGIDIDDTLTDIKDKLYDTGVEFARMLGKTGDFVKKDANNDPKNDGGIFQEIFGFNDQEVKEFYKYVEEKVTNKAIPRENAIKVIRELKEMGHTIIIITARDSELHEDPYKESKDWLDKNNIYYDKLIADVRDKGIPCLEEKIDLFIDDNINNCLRVSSLGIETIRLCNEKEFNENFETLTNWNEIYNYIINMK